MQYLYEQLRQSEQIPDAYERWKEYRKSFTDYILTRAGGVKSIAILGAGACNDINLNSLLAVGHNITLLDCDDKSMQQGVLRQLGDNFIMRDSVQQKHLNVWPVTVEEYHTLEEMLFSKTPMATILDFLKTVTERIARLTLTATEETYDMLICSGFHSQITVIFVSLLQYYMQKFNVNYSSTEVNAYLQMIENMNVIMVKRVQEYIEKVGKTFLIGYEYGSFDEGDERIYEVKEKFQQGRADLAAKMGISRVQGAVQLERLLSTEYAQKEIVFTNWRYFVWPFLPEKQYLMIVYEGHRL